MPRNKPVKLKPVKPSRAVANRYARDIAVLIKAMVRDYWGLVVIYKDKRWQVSGDDIGGVWLTTEIEKRFKTLGKKWQKEFEKFAEGKSKEVIAKILKQTDLQLKSSLKDYMASQYFMLIGETIPVSMRIMMKAQVAENVALIKSIPEEFKHRIEGAVYRAITGSGTLRNLRDEIAKYGDMSLRRAKLISSDQTSKIFSVLAMQRMKQAGIRRCMWVHTGRGKTHREYHKRKWDGVSGLKDGRPNGLNGFIFDMDNPPVIEQKTGQRGIPGELPFCHCEVAPVIDGGE